MASAVFDSSAVLAMLFHEAGAEEVLAALGDPLLSAVNLAEVLSTLVHRGLAIEKAQSLLAPYALPIAPFDSELAQITGSLRKDTASLGLSLGDRACLALGLREKAAVYTADRNWSRLSLDLKIQVIRGQ